MLEVLYGGGQLNTLPDGRACCWDIPHDEYSASLRSCPFPVRNTVHQSENHQCETSGKIIKQ